MLDGTRPSGYVARPSLRKAESSWRSRGAYQKAIEVAPECYDGYRGLTSLYERQEKWEDALEWHQRAPLYQKQWAGIARAKVGEMYSKLENYVEAEKVLKAELRTDKENDIARAALETLADSYGKSRDTRSMATRIYDEILDILGDSYKGTYYNRLGNLSRSHGDNRQAAKEYRDAIAAQPHDPVLHRNLAVAYQGLKDYSQAVEELDLAVRIDGDTQKHNRQMALLRNEEANDYFARGEYRKAIQQYDVAIVHDSNDAVIHANRASAWELLQEPGGRRRPSTMRSKL